MQGDAVFLLSLVGGALTLILGAAVYLLIFFRQQKARRQKMKAPVPLKADLPPAGASGGHPAAAMRLLHEATGDAWQIEALPATVGRHPGNTVVLKGDMISGSHAKIYFDDALQAICIADLDSKNGAYVNGLPTKRNLLQDQDQITLGNLNLVFQHKSS